MTADMKAAREIAAAESRRKELEADYDNISGQLAVAHAELEAERKARKEAFKAANNVLDTYDVKSAPLHDRVFALGQKLESAEQRAAELQTRCARLERELTTLRTAHEAAQGEIAALKRGEYICQKCGLRKDGEYEKGDF